MRKIYKIRVSASLMRKIYKIRVPTSLMRIYTIQVSASSMRENKKYNFQRLIKIVDVSDTQW
jgi:ribosomal protein L28